MQRNDENMANMSSLGSSLFKLISYFSQRDQMEEDITKLGSSNRSKKRGKMAATTTQAPMVFEN